MLGVVDELAFLPFFTNVPRPEIEKAAPRFERVTLLVGEPLWQEGTESGALAIVLSGELAVTSRGKNIATLRMREIAGEASAFFPGQKRTASLTASRASDVLILRTEDLRALRWQKSRVYDALLDVALQALVRRVHATNVRIGDLASGSVASPERKEPGALVRLWRTLRPGGPSGPCPALGPLLRTQPGLRDMDAEVETALSAAFVAEPMTEGQIIVLEGEMGLGGYIVGEGSIDVLRNVRGDKAELLVKLGEGQQFGMNTLVATSARTASCVGASAGWLYRLDGNAYEQLRGDARRLWRESVLATLSGQISSANAALDRAMRDAARRGPAKAGATTGAKAGAKRAISAEDGFKNLLEASGYLESLPVNSAALGAMEFVVDEDMKRNPKNRNIRR